MEPCPSLRSASSLHFLGGFQGAVLSGRAHMRGWSAALPLSLTIGAMSTDPLLCPFPGPHSRPLRIMFQGAIPSAPQKGACGERGLP